MTDNDDYMVGKTTGNTITELMWDRLQEGINANRRYRVKAVAGADDMVYDTTKVIWASDIFIYFTRESDGAWVYNKINANPTTGITCNDNDLLYVTLNDTTATVLTVNSADYTSMPTDDTGHILILGAVWNGVWYGNIIGGGGGGGWLNPAEESLDMAGYNIDMGTGSIIVDSGGDKTLTAGELAYLDGLTENVQTHMTAGNPHSTSEPANANIQSHVASPPVDSHHTKYALTDDLASTEITAIQNIGATAILLAAWEQAGGITKTHVGLSGGQGLDVPSTELDWSNLGWLYSAMINSTVGIDEGAPVDTYGYFLKIAQRDSAGGWGGLWCGYSADNNYLGRTATSASYATWEKIAMHGTAVSLTTLTLTSIAAEGTDVDKFVVSNAGLLKYRTGTQVLGDIGAAATGEAHALATSGPHTGTLPLTDLAVGVAGDIIYRGASDWQVLSKGTSTYVLTMGATYPAWAEAPAGYDDAAAIAAVQGEATLTLGAQVSIDGSGWLEGGNSPGGTTALEYNGYFYPTRCYNAVYNDFADYWGKLRKGETPIPGRVYVTDVGKRVKVADRRADMGALGICSDTYGFASGKNVGDVPLSVAGFVLAYVDMEYLRGTWLVNDEKGGLTVAQPGEEFRAIAKFVTKEKEKHLNTKTEMITVNGRCWVKVM